MSRVDDILNYKKNQEIAERNREIEKDAERKVLVERVRELKPRIDQILAVGNACRDAGIPLTGQAWGGHEGYDTNQFITNNWSHLVGFVNLGNHYPISEMGINGGGACGKWDFRTNGVQVYEVSSGEVQEPQIHHMRKFLEKFDDFEKSFYGYVDRLTEKNKGVVPLDPEKVEASKPVEISSNRLSVLAYNAIMLLEENGFVVEDLMDEIGITPSEYKAIVGREVAQPSLDSEIAKADSKRVARENSTSPDKNDIER